MTITTTLSLDAARAGFDFATLFIRAQNDPALFAKATVALAELAQIDHSYQRISAKPPTIAPVIVLIIVLAVSGLSNK